MKKLGKTVTKIGKEDLLHLSCSPPGGIISPNCGVFIKIKTLTLVQCYLLSYRIYSDFASFSSDVLSLCQDLILDNTVHLVMQLITSICVSFSAFLYFQ